LLFKGKKRWIIFLFAKLTAAGETVENIKVGIFYLVFFN
jgi:hypothetical protein